MFNLIFLTLISFSFANMVPVHVASHMAPTHSAQASHPSGHKAPNHVQYVPVFIHVTPEENSSPPENTLNGNGQWLGSNGVAVSSLSPSTNGLVQTMFIYNVTYNLLLADECVVQNATAYVSQLAEQALTLIPTLYQYPENALPLLDQMEKIAKQIELVYQLQMPNAACVNTSGMIFTSVIIILIMFSF